MRWKLKASLWGAAVLVALFVTVWSVWSNAERLPKQYLESAEQKWRTHDYLGAVRGYEKISEEFPRSKFVPEATYWSGVLYYLYLNDPQKAVDALEKTIRLTASTPKNAHALAARRYLAEVFEKKYGKLREAISELEKVMELSDDPDQVLESQYKIGELYLAQGNIEQARTEWDLLVKRDPKSRWAPPALYRQGSSYFIEGKCKDAIEYYQRLIADYPDSDMSPFAKFRTANCLEEGSQIEEALNVYRSLEGHYPNKELLEAKIKQLEKGGPKTVNVAPPEEPVTAPPGPEHIPARED